MYLFKLLVLGLDDAVTRVFLETAGTYMISPEYKRSLGASIGVHTCHVEGEDVKMQVWDVAVDDLSPMSRLMLSGGQGSLYLLYPHQLKTVKMLRREVRWRCGGIPELFLLLGSKREISRLSQRMDGALFQGYVKPDGAFSRIASMILRHRTGGAGVPPFGFAALRLPRRRVRAVQSRMLRARTLGAAASHTLLECLESGGFKVTDGLVTLYAYDAIFQVNVVTGAVRFEPLRCFSCARGFRRWRSLCLVAVSRGWSSVALSQRELEVLAKVYAIASESLPPGPEGQVVELVRRAWSCSNYDPMPQPGEIDSVSLLMDELLGHTAQMGT